MSYIQWHVERSSLALDKVYICLKLIFHNILIFCFSMLLCGGEMTL